MRNVLWVGSFITELLYKELQTIGYKNSASYISQRNLLNGLEEVYSQPFDSIGAIALQGYPTNRCLLFRKKRFHHAPGANDTLVGFLNIKYLNRLFGQISLARSAKAWIKQHAPDSSKVDIFIYEMRSSCLYVAAVIKRFAPSSKIHLIVPDVPQYMDLNMGQIKKLLKAIDWIGIKRKLMFIDDFILYSEPMVDYLGIRDKKWMVMEGSINVSDFDLLNVTNIVKYENDMPVNNKTIVMYSGYIDRQFGLFSLIDAFQDLGQNYELWISGSGPDEATIIQKAMKDERIKFLGFLPQRSDLLKLQGRATMFVNMRDPAVEASKYCFPSKIFEYLLCGKPVLSCRLGGIPDEYFDYLVEMQDLSSEAIAATISRVAEMSSKEREDIGIRGREFLIREKNNLSQARRIKKFLDAAL